MTSLAVYAGLFLAALAAGSALPVPSEAAFAGVVLTTTDPLWIAITVATTGNVVGSFINWLIGRGVETLKHERWFPASERQLEKAKVWYHRYGRWSLLLSFVPIIGDPLTIVAGVMREPLWSFIPLVTIAKGARYIVLAALLLGWL
ncbi:MAG: DedA family protein [Alphaproteobacteria bacterium]|nr:MAG: DedA family protein [Alphaproteobacteria bacterium]